MFKSTYNSGFTITFNNKFTVSVQYGSGWKNKGYENKATDIKEPIVESFTAQVTIYDDKENAVVIDNESIFYYQTPEQVAHLIWITSKAITKADIIKHFIVHQEEDWE